MLGVIIYGYNPYITNTIDRNQPFYPVLGSKQFPTDDRGFDGNETLETPENMRGKLISTRLFYAYFSKPGNAPYTSKNAVITIPFKPNIDEWKAYHFHETSIGRIWPIFWWHTYIIKCPPTINTN
ncbi:MAG TPA: hypothetical protein VF691_03605 [Cytophagaceae bacterium]